MELFGYFASLIMGITLGLLGGGGSILTVPILIYLFRLDPVTATTSSLFIVGFTAIFAAVKYAKNKTIDFKTGLVFALPSFAGIFLARSVLLPAIPDTVASVAGIVLTKAILILFSFAVLMMVAAIAILRKRAPSEDNVSKASLLKVAPYGAGVGFVTGFVGAGGGFLILPALVSLLGLRMREAVGTSLFIIALNSLSGFGLSLLRESTINWSLQFGILGIATAGSFIGAHFSGKFSERTLRKLFGYFVLITAFGILTDQILKLLRP